MSSKRQTVPENVSIDLELMPSAPGSTFDCRPATHRWPSLCDEWQAHANFSQHAGEAIAIDDRVLAPGVYDLFVAVNVRTSSGSFVTTPLTGMRERIRIGPTWTTTSVQLWPGSRWSKPVSVRLRGRPSQMPDGDMCVHPIGPSGWECSTSELFRCELVIDRGPDRGVHAQEECFESLAYQQLHNRLCSRGVRMRWSEFDRKTRCHPVQPR